MAFAHSSLPLNLCHGGRSRGASVRAPSTLRMGSLVVRNTAMEERAAQQVMDGACLVCDVKYADLRLCRWFHRFKGPGCFGLALSDGYQNGAFFRSIASVALVVPNALAFLRSSEGSRALSCARVAEARASFAQFGAQQLYVLASF